MFRKSEEHRHQQEDESLERYIERSYAMDVASSRLAAIVPRGWVILALATLTPALVAGTTPTQMALSIGGILLAYRALQRLSTGLSSLSGAAIAARSVQGLVQAAARTEAAALPSVVLPPRLRGTTADGVAADVRDITFRYRPGGPGVLRGCSLRIARGARLLLEGASGCGKTTFASILAGLQPPESGVLLVGGLDRSALGAAGWRSRVIMAPQAHDNYLVTGSLAFNLSPRQALAAGTR